MKILYLYTEIMGYQTVIFKEYVDRYKANVHVVHWDQNRLAKYKLPQINNVTFYNRSSHTTNELKELVTSIKPDIVYISGWMDKGYLSAANVLRKKGVPIVCGFDDIWRGSLRQTVASKVFPISLKRVLQYAWVAGPYQYEYAKRLGYKNNEIIFNCLSADTEFFNRVYRDSKECKLSKYPHRFLYVGRFEEIKGIDLIISAWQNIKPKRKDWELCFIGNGSLGKYLLEQADVTIKDFMQPEQLADEIKLCGCFIMASRREPWGLVLHEFAAAGLPIVCADVCGATPVFITDKYNGYIAKANDQKDLEKKMLRIIYSTDGELVSMSQNSHKNGQKITPEISAASFVSILDS